MENSKKLKDVGYASKTDKIVAAYERARARAEATLDKNDQVATSLEDE